jgi:hypothetical protein
VPTHSSNYWTVDFPGLNEAQANEIVQRGAELGFDGFTVDPALFLTMSIDRPTVEALSEALGDRASDPMTAGVLELLQAWLASAD